MFNPIDGVNMKPKKITKANAIASFKKALSHKKEAKRKMEEEYAMQGKKVNVIVL